MSKKAAKLLLIFEDDAWSSEHDTWLLSLINISRTQVLTWTFLITKKKDIILCSVIFWIKRKFTQRTELHSNTNQSLENWKENQTLYEPLSAAKNFK